MNPREWCMVSLALGLMSLILPFARTNPLGGPLSDVWATINLGEALWYSTETPFSIAANLFIIGVLVVYLHAAGSLLMAGAVSYASYVAFVGQGFQPAFGFYIALAAALTGLYALYRKHLSQYMPRKCRVVYASDLWV